LVTALTLTGVVKATIRHPDIVVSVLLSGIWIGKNEDVGGLSRWADPPSGTPAEFFVESLSFNAPARL
jgi:hypothetical protein